MSTDSRMPLKRRLNARDWDHELDEGDWVSDLRRICLDNLTRSAMDRRRPTLKDRLFPLSSGTTLTMSDVMYSEGIWSAGTLAACFVAYVVSEGSLEQAINFLLITSLVILPLLPVWTGLGYYYVRKRERRNRFP